METKHTYRFYSEYDTKGIAEFLNQMATKGWMLAKKSGVYYRFVKTDKAFVKYDITYFADASKDNDYLPYGSDRYFEMRQAAGWQFVTNDNKMMIFISENPDAPPLETEPMIKVDVIHKSFLSQNLVLYLILMLTGFIRLLDGHLDFMDSMLLLSALVLAWELFCYTIWYFKAKKAAADGWYYETKTPFIRMYIDPIILLIMVIWLLKTIGIKATIFFMVIAVACFATKE